MTGLENTGVPKGQKLARDLVDKWVKNVYVSYVQSKNKMFEKYDVEQASLNFKRGFQPFLATSFAQVGLPGGGGEYDVQEGFGWSNGVMMHFLSKYDDLISPDVETNDAAMKRLNLFAMVLMLVNVILL